MRKSGPQVVTIFTLTLAALGGSAPLDAQQAFPANGQPLDPVQFEVSPTVKERTTVENTDGSRLVGGHFGGQQETCGVGTQAFVRRFAADQTLEWERCAGSDGECAQSGGLPLFAGSAADGLVEASSVHAIASDPVSGAVFVAGEAIVATDSGAIATSRVAFLTKLAPDGSVLAQQIVGDLPGGPPVAEGCCLDLCDDEGAGACPGGGGGTQCGGRGVALLADTGVAMTGWCEIPGSPNGPDVLVARYDENLAELWSDVLGTSAKDVGLAVTLNAQGEVFYTGYGLPEHEFFVAKHTPAGVLESYSVGGGAHFDQGYGISLDGSGDPVVELFVTGEATFDGQAFGDPSDDRQDFILELDRNDLSIQQVEPQITQTPLVTFGPGVAKNRQIGSQPGPEPPAPALTLDSYYIEIGEWGTGDLGDLEHSDDFFLYLREGPDPADPSHFLLRFGIVFDPSEAAFKLSTASVELAADDCYTATMWLKGYLDETLYELGSQKICPLDQPVLSAPISAELSAALGFDGVRVPGVDDRLDLIVEMDFDTYACPTASTQTEETTVDEISVDPEI